MLSGLTNYVPETALTVFDNLESRLPDRNLQQDKA